MEYILMQRLPAKLPFVIDCLHKDLPISNTLLQQILPPSQPTHTLIQLLRTMQHQSHSSTPPPHILHNLLIALLPLAQLKSPLKELTAGEHQLFSQHCLNSTDPSLALVNARSYGLFPPFSKHSPIMPLYLRTADKDCRDGQWGNPNWFTSRKALQIWCYHQDNLSSQALQLCQFLLSNQNLLNRWNGLDLKNLWFLLYAKYIQVILDEPSLNLPLELVTWVRTSQEDFTNSLTKLKNALVSQNRFYCLMVLCQLFEGSPADFNSLFQQTFSCFMQHYVESCSWSYALALALFTKISHKHQQPAIANLCLQRYLSLLQSSQHALEMAVFIELFLQGQDLIQYIHKHSLPYWQLSLTPLSLKAIAKHIFLHATVDPQCLKFLATQHYSECLFKSPRWRQRSFAEATIHALEVSEVVCKRLGGMVKVTDIDRVQTNLNRFLEVWKNYYYNLTNIISQEELLIHILLLDHDVFDGPFRDVFVLPTDHSSLLFDLLTKLVHLFSHKIEKEGIEQARQEAQGLGQHLSQLLLRLSVEQKQKIYQSWQQAVGDALLGFAEFFGL